jgi:hypothetical protein
MTTASGTRRVLGCGALVAALALSATSARGQDISQEWTGPPHLSLELAKPFFEDDGFTTFSGLGYLSGTFGSGRTRFLVELPFARGGIDNVESSSSSLIGSPFVGVARLSSTEGRGVSGSLGVRIPVPESFEFGDDDFAVAIGGIGDPDRLEAFLTETLTLSGAVRFEGSVAESVLLRAQVDADGLFFLDTEGDAVEAFLGWAGLARWEGDGPFAAGQVTGRILLTEDGDDRVTHHLHGRAGWSFGSVQPWIGARVPIQGQTTDFVSWTLQLGLRIDLGS